MKSIFYSLGLVSMFCLMAATYPVHGGYHVGDKAEDFKLMNVSGDFVSLSDYKDVEGYVVIFTCNTCPYSVVYEDRIIELHNRTSEKGFPVVAINPNDPEVRPGDNFASMQERHATKAFPFVYLFDEGQKVYPKFGATKTPHVYILDKDLTVRYIGAIDDSAKDPEGVSVNYVDGAVDAIRAGNKVSPETTKAIGCSIKVKK